jgi:hypothetical protein
MKKRVNRHSYNYRFSRFCLLTCFMCLFATFNLCASVESVQATVDKNPVMLDESFTLSITADGDVDRDAFDSSILLNDFVFGQTSVSSQTRMVNFSTSRSTTWNVILFPREVGRFTIPSIAIEGVASAPIAIEVIPVSNVDGTETRDIFVTTELDNSEVYLHQQVKYTVKLYLARDIERGSLQAPELSGAEIQQIGKDAEYSEIINGKRYRIIERQFVLIPQQSGEFTINGPVFQGEVVANTRQSFGFFNRTQTVNRVGPSLSLKVLPVPDSVTDAFLPSEFVDLRDEWSSDLNEWRVGEPVTRTLSLTAVGLTESLLPEIDDTYPPDIKTYPDQADTASVEQDQQLVSQRNESTALIPSRAGTFVLPEVTIEWFNIVTKQLETARLPARSVTVLPALTSEQISTPPPTESAADQDASPAVPAEQRVQTEYQSVAAPKVWDWRLNNGWMWSTFLLSMSTLALMIKVFTHSSPCTTKQQKSSPDQKERVLWDTLSQHLSTHSADAIAGALLVWLNHVSVSHDATLSSAIARINDRRLKELVDQMMHSRYAKQSSQWQSTELAQHLRILRKQKLSDQQSQSPLAELYPTN